MTIDDSESPPPKLLGELLAVGAYAASYASKECNGFASIRTCSL